jgi:predicted RecA/RadA family phage recombinase
MKNFVQPGDVLTLIAPAGGVQSGQPFVVNSIFGIATHDAIEGAEVEAQVVGVFEFAKMPGAIAQGAPVWWDDTAKVIKGASAAGLYPVGVATEGAAADAPSVRVRLSGVPVAAVPGT